MSRALSGAAEDRTDGAGGTYLLLAPLLVSVPPGAALGLLVLFLLVAAGIWWWRRESGSRRGRPSGSFPGDPPLIFPLLPSDPPEVLRAGRAARPAPPRRPRPATPQAGPELIPQEPLPPAPAPAEDAPFKVTSTRTRSAPKRRTPAEAASAEKAQSKRPARPTRATRQAPAEAVVEAPREIPAAGPAAPLRPAAVLSPAARAATPVPLGAEEGELFDGNTVRYYRPVEGTMQFLPGRLEIVEGEDSGQDIRFVRIWGATPEVTFGRHTGPPHRHVQLRARTVSREHARMTFEEDRWRIHNLSQTNPIVVNGQELPSAAAGQTLADGDLIEMGEVVFRFRER